MTDAKTRYGYRYIVVVRYDTETFPTPFRSAPFSLPVAQKIASDLRALGVNAEVQDA